ncbi:DUF262 domain-containing protein [Sphingobium terrigena]|uniref:DUF262 domain-containing protein n=2 Tax=Sphingobium terrigena TaxID=2304063 RepID=A0A418YXC2_9SPHN|nr:DUF262 domain-containing protein [Sphingobium terrigena]
MSDDVLIEENLEEELQDLEVSGDWSRGAVLWSTDWTTETVISQLDKQNIDLDPSFQRRSAWDEKKQSLFIESLALGLPIPQLILAENRKKRGSFIVIDGKQRLLALRRFGSTKPNTGFTPLKLRGLQKLKNLNGKTYADMQQDLGLDDDRAAFENSSIRTIIIRNADQEEYLYEVFLRINTGSVQLSPQELRQALHPGPFSTFVNEASAASQELRATLKLKEPDFRMRDAEILLRFLAYSNFIDTYAGNLKVFLDRTTEALNDDWPTREVELRTQVTEFENALEFTRNAFGDKFYLRKWNGKEFESKKNRAVFDIMLHYFSDQTIRQALAGKEKDITDAFVKLCDQDDFRSSLETTTKSIEANRIRFNRWGDAVQALSGVDTSSKKFTG